MFTNTAPPFLSSSYIICVVIYVAIAVNGCPDHCICFLSTVRCTNAGLRFIPRTEMPGATTVLDLRYNVIKKVRKVDMENLPNLITLFLSNNLIHYIEPGAFMSLKNLKYLYLYSNNIKNITSDTIAGLTQMEQLYLQHNDIDYISTDAFLDLNKLERLYLQRNRLRSIDRGLLEPLNKLKRLRLESNRLDCNCELLFTIEEFTKSRDTHVAATCHEPASKRGRMLSTLSKNDLNCGPPTLTSRRDDIYEDVGETVEIPCQGQGNPKPVAFWQKDGRPLPTVSRFKIKSDGTLVIYEIQDHDAGTYECSLENMLGKVSVNVIVKTNIIEEEALPSFTQMPENTEAIIRNSARLHCRANGRPKPKIIWSREGEALPDDPRYRQLPHGDLEIVEVSPKDHGYFTCRAQNSVGSITHTANLIVKAPPVFTLKPSDQETLDSITVSFPCRASGHPSPAIAWHKDSSRLPNDGRYVVLPSGTLRILYAKKEDEGTYQCQAINVVGVIVTTATLTINARVKPKITSKPPDTTVQSGNTIFFRCIASGAPSPVISWIKDGVQVSSGNRFTANSSSGALEIRDIGKIDEGRWECAARNTIGFVSEVFHLTVIGPKDGKYEGDKYVRPSVEKARSEVNRAIQQTKDKLKNFTPRTSSDLLALFRFPSPEAIEMARAAEIFELALSFIQTKVDFNEFNDVISGSPADSHFNALVSPDHIRLLANLSGCTAHHRPANCSDLCFHLKFRTPDGSCNNFNHPMWGAALTPFIRLLSPVYENGFNTPVGWNTSSGIPSARLVSRELMSSETVTDDLDYTHMTMQWGQFLDHDMDFTATSPSTTRFNDGVPCKDTCDNQHPCFPIQIPPGDPRIRRHRCMEFTRSSAVCGSGSTSVFFNAIMPRQQTNQITSYLDASNVYGSTVHDANDLRDLRGKKGLLKTGLLGPTGKAFLPFNKDTPIDCQVNKSESQVPCFLSGDHRANEQLGLLSMHTIWMREHNRIAKTLGELNPKWDGERIYQESRKIVGAEMQHITFNEWLPKILGHGGMNRIGKYDHYNPNIDASIFNAFATAAMRFGHSIIQPVLARLNSSFLPIEQGNIPLHKAFFSPYRLIQEGGIDPLLRGLFGTALKSRIDTDNLMNSELTEHLFQMVHAIALDLAALNIQRGRDHGLPGYNSWREYCNMSAVTTFEGLAEEIKGPEVRAKLQKLYSNPDHIDLFVAGVVEDPLPGSRIGPLLTCLLSTQFKRIRSGDRFWYENPGVFKPEQLTQLKQITLAKVICQNGDRIDRVQRDVFRRVKSESEYLPCSEIAGLDLTFWKECCTKEESCPSEIPSFTLSNVFRRRRSLDNNADTSTPDTETEKSDTTTEKSETTTEKSETTTEKSDTRTSLPETVQDLQERVDVLEQLISNSTEAIQDMRNEVKDLKLYLRQKILTCEDQNGIVRKDGEKWEEKDGDLCQCQQGRLKCKRKNY